MIHYTVERLFWVFDQLEFSCPDSPVLVPANLVHAVIQVGFLNIMVKTILSEYDSKSPSVRYNEEIRPVKVRSGILRYYACSISEDNARSPTTVPLGRLMQFSIVFIALEILPIQAHKLQPPNSVTM